MERDMAAGEKNGHIPRFLNRESSHQPLRQDPCHDLHTPCGAADTVILPASDYRAGYAAWAEALMRWKHPVAGYIAPPLAIAWHMKMASSMNSATIF